MNYIPRTISPKILRAGEYFPVIVVTGPRQSGKSTLCDQLFKDYTKYNFENIGLRQAVMSDPKGFLESCGEKTVIDEVQRVPELLSYLQLIVDNEPQRRFAITGSSNFALMEQVTQSLAGRAALFTLLPLAFTEIGDYLNSPTNTLLINGFYPSVITGKRPYDLFYPNYYSTYVERDLRQIKNISDLTQFQTFVRLAAGRCGSEFNASQLSVETGVSSVTIKKWMSVLQASYIAFLLPPYFANINKRLTKTPKIYFYDTGLLCFLLGIENEQQLSTHPLRGAIFENMAITELLKNQYNLGALPNIYFYRENAGREADAVKVTNEQLEIFEIKSSATYSTAFAKNLNYLKELFPDKIAKAQVVYDGDAIPPIAINIRQLP